MRQCLPSLSFSLCSSWLMDPSNQMEAKAFILPRRTKTTETKDSKCHILVLFFIFLTNKQTPKLKFSQNESTNANNHKATRSAQNLIETPRSKPQKQHHGHREHHHSSMCHPSKAWPLAIKPGAPDLVCLFNKVQGVVNTFTTIPWKCHQVGSNHFFLRILHPSSYFPFGLGHRCSVQSQWQTNQTR